MGFIIEWAKSRKNIDFLDTQQKALNKWEKRNGKKPVRSNAAAAAPAFPDLFAVPSFSSQEPNENYVPTPIDQQVDEEMNVLAGTARTQNYPTPARHVSPIPTTIPAAPIYSPIRTTMRKRNSPPPVAGPSNPRRDAIHIYPSFTQLADSSDDEPIIPRKRTHHPTDDNEEDTEYENERPPVSDYQEKRPAQRKPTKGKDDEKRTRRIPPSTNDLEDLKKNLPSQPPGGRREACPTGEFYDPPCSQCVRRESVCEMERYVAACVRCYNGKNKCDYGGRRREAPAQYQKRRKVPARKSTPAPETEEEMVGHRYDGPANGERPAKRVKIAAVDDEEEENDSEDINPTIPPPPPSSKPRRLAAKKAAAKIAGVDYDEQEDESMDDTAPPPTPQPSSSKPRRVAAKKAQAAVAAALKMDDKFREPSKARKTYGKSKGIYLFLSSYYVGLSKFRITAGHAR
jgi:hypothetical protein